MPCSTVQELSRLDQGGWLVYGRQGAPYRGPCKTADGIASVQQHAPCRLCMHGQTRRVISIIMQGAMRRCSVSLRSSTWRQFTHLQAECCRGPPIAKQAVDLFGLGIEEKAEGIPTNACTPGTAVGTKLDSILGICSGGAAAEGQSLSPVQPWVAAGAQASLSPILQHMWGPASTQQQQKRKCVCPQCSITYQDCRRQFWVQQASGQQVGSREWLTCGAGLGHVEPSGHSHSRICCIATPLQDAHAGLQQPGTGRHGDHEPGPSQHDCKLS